MEWYFLVLLGLLVVWNLWLTSEIRKGRLLVNAFMRGAQLVLRDGHHWTELQDDELFKHIFKVFGNEIRDMLEKHRP